MPDSPFCRRIQKETVTDEWVARQRRDADSERLHLELAMVGATRGYDVRIVMPASRSPERRQVMQAYGAAIELVDGGMETANARASELADEPGVIELSQFENPANPRAHYETTGAELLDQLGDRTPDALVAGVGTGGTISGVGRRLREAFPAVDIVAVEPASNAVLSGETGDPEGDEYQGMGPGFVSANLDRELLDDVETVSLERAEAECRRLAREESILVGQSSGASNVAAKRVARRLREERQDPLVVTVFWDSGERYLTTGLFEDDA